MIFAYNILLYKNMDIQKFKVKILGEGFTIIELVMVIVIAANLEKIRPGLEQSRQDT